MAELTAPAIMVTGAAKRLGRATAIALADAGYDIILHYHQSNDDAHETASHLATRGASVAMLRHDLSQTETLDDLMKHAKTLAPHLCGLVNAAAIFEPDDLQSMSLDAFSRQMAINLHAPVMLARGFARHAGKGCIINFIDNLIHKHQSRFFSYLLSKKSLHDATLMLAANLGPDIRVHGICPGAILPAHQFDENYIQQRNLKTPLKRTPTPEEIAETVTWLMDAEHLTGQIITLDSGEHLCW